MRRVAQAALLACAALALLAPAADAATRYASPTGTGPEATCPQAEPCSVRDAVEAPSVEAGDEILLEGGVYDMEGASLGVSQPITLRPAPGAGRPQITSATTSAVELHAPGATLEGLLVRGSEFGSLHGGVINVTYPSGGGLIDRTIVIAGEEVTNALVGGGGITVRNSAIYTESAGGAAVTGRTGATTLINVTAISDPTSPVNSVGVVSNNCYGENSILVENSIVSGGEYDFTLSEGCPSGPVGIEAVYSNFDPAKVRSYGPAELIEGPGNQSAPPSLVDPANADFDQLGASPTRNAGDTALAQGSLDLNGDARVQEGAVDIGADEFDVAPPSEEAPPSPPPPGPSPPGPPPEVAPLLEHLRVSNRRFATTKPSRRARSRVKRSTTFRYWLSKPASVTFKISRAVIGRKLGGKCRRRTKADRKHKHCALRYRYVGRFDRSGKQGANKAKFAGRVRARNGKRVKLPPGTYRVVAIAFDSARGRSVPHSAWFRVVPR